MSRQFHIIELFAFDFHVAAAPLARRRSTLLQPKLRFLVSPTAYAKQYRTQGVVETDTFRIRPLTERMLKRNHFWKYYRRLAVKNGKPDYWSLQLPFMCEPLRDVLALPPAIHRGARTTIFLWGWGWSTNVHLRLRAPLASDDVVELIGALKDKARTPLSLNGHSVGLSTLFKTYANYLLRELYVDGHDVHDALKLPRYFVVSFATDGLGFYRPSGPGVPQMSDADRAMIHSVLLGRPVTVEEWATQERARSFTLTPFRTASFGLTDFTEATVLKMEPWDKEGQLGCHAANIRSLIMLTRGFLALLGDPASLSTDAKGRALETAMISLLQRLRDAYRNRYCETLYRDYGPLKRFADGRGEVIETPPGPA